MTALCINIVCKHRSHHISPMMMEINTVFETSNTAEISLWSLGKKVRRVSCLLLLGVSIYNGRLHSDGFRSCDDVFLRLQCGCSLWCWYSKGAREEFEMLRSLQPYLMCIAFGLTLLRWLNSTCFAVIGIVWNMAMGKLRKNLKQVRVIKMKSWLGELRFIYPFGHSMKASWVFNYHSLLINFVLKNKKPPSFHELDSAWPIKQLSESVWSLCLILFSRKINVIWSDVMFK